MVFAFIKNHEGKFLIAQRAANKTHAHTWEIPAGASIQEDSQSAVLREVKEEVGISLHPSKGKIVKSFTREGAKFVEVEEIFNLVASSQFMVGMPEVLDCLELLS